VGNQPARIEEDQLIWPIESDFCAAVILLSNAVGGAARKPARRSK
jgi:hypothetical protein